MKAVILAGGLGTRFSEETSVRPKPMIEIGGKPAGTATGTPVSRQGPEAQTAAEQQQS